MEKNTTYELQEKPNENSLKKSLQELQQTVVQSYFDTFANTSKVEMPETSKNKQNIQKNNDIHSPTQSFTFPSTYEKGKKLQFETPKFSQFAPKNISAKEDSYFALWESHEKDAHITGAISERGYTVGPNIQWEDPSINIIHPNRPCTIHGQNGYTFAWTTDIPLPGTDKAPPYTVREVHIPQGEYTVEYRLITSENTLDKYEDNFLEELSHSTTFQTPLSTVTKKQMDAQLDKDGKLDPMVKEFQKEYDSFDKTKQIIDKEIKNAPLPVQKKWKIWQEKLELRHPNYKSGDRLFLNHTEDRPAWKIGSMDLTDFGDVEEGSALLSIFEDTGDTLIMRGFPEKKFTREFGAHMEIFRLLASPAYQKQFMKKNGLHVFPISMEYINEENIYDEATLNDIRAEKNTSTRIKQIDEEMYSASEVIQKKWQFFKKKYGSFSALGKIGEYTEYRATINDLDPLFYKIFEYQEPYFVKLLKGGSLKVGEGNDTYDYIESNERYFYPYTAYLELFSMLATNEIDTEAYTDLFEKEIIEDQRQMRSQGT